MATLDQDDLDAISALIENSLLINKISRYVRILNSTYISAGEWDFTNPGCLSDFVWTGTATGLIEINVYDIATNQANSLGSLDLSTMIFTENFTGVVTTEAFVYVYADTVPAGRLSFTVNTVSAGGVTVPYNVAFDLPSTSGGVTMLPHKDGSVQRLFDGATIATTLGQYVTLSQIEASTWLLKTKTEGQNAVEVDPDGDVIVKTRRSFESDQFEPVATMRQARYLFKDFFGVSFLDTQSNPAITINGVYEIDGTTPKATTGALIVVSGATAETGYYQTAASPIGTWDDQNGFVNDAGFGYMNNGYFVLSISGLADNGTVIDWTVNTLAGGNNMRSKIPANSGRSTFVPMADGSVTGYAGAGKWEFGTIVTKANLVEIQGIDTNTGNAILQLRKLSVSNSDGDPAVEITNVGDNTPALYIQNQGTGQAVKFLGVGGPGMYIATDAGVHTASLLLSNDIKSEQQGNYKLMEATKRVYDMFRTGTGLLSIDGMTTMTVAQTGGTTLLSGTVIEFSALQPDAQPADQKTTIGTYDVDNGWVEDPMWPGNTSQSNLRIYINTGGNYVAAFQLTISYTIRGAENRSLVIDFPYSGTGGVDYVITRDGKLGDYLGNPLYPAPSGATLQEIEGSSSLAMKSDVGNLRRTFRHMFSSDFISCFPWIIDALGTDPRVNDITLSYSQTWPTGGNIELQMINMQADPEQYKTIGEWDGSTFTYAGDWDGSISEYYVLYLSYYGGETDLPAGNLSITVNTRVGPSPRTYVIPLPAWNKDTFLDVVPRYNKAVNAWAGGNIIPAATVAVNRELITNTNPHQLVYTEDGVEIARFNLTRDVNGNYIARTKV